MYAKIKTNKLMVLILVPLNRAQKENRKICMYELVYIAQERNSLSHSYIAPEFFLLISFSFLIVLLFLYFAVCEHNYLSVC